MKFYTKFIHPFPLLVLSAFVCAGTFSACTKEDEISIYPIQEGRFDLNEDEYVTMQIVTKEGSDNPSAFLRIENHTEKSLGYGLPYSLQYYNKNSWGPNLLDGLIWYSIGCGLFAGETEEREDIAPDIKTYNNNKKGRYKLTKQFVLFNSHSIAEAEEVIGGIILSTEFEVK